MANGKRIIDYLDLQIEVPEAVQATVIAAIEQFEDEHLHIESKPKYRKGVLAVNSTDLISLLGYLSSAGVEEFSLHRFRKNIRQALDQQLLKSLSLDMQSHYKWCLAALKSLESGRFLDEPLESE